jgi:hypothetical protein
LELPVYYSLGFHSKPVMVFGPALSLGVASLAEYVDVKLCAREGTRWDELPARLNEATLDGLEFFGARLLSSHDAKLSHAIEEAQYVAALPHASLAACGLADAQALDKLVRERAQGELRTRRTVEGVGKWVDVHRYLVNAEVGAGAEALERAGLVGDLLPIRIQLRFTDAGTAKVSEALDTLLGTTDVPARFVRERLVWRSGDVVGEPLELERFRSVRGAASAATIGLPVEPVNLPHA